METVRDLVVRVRLERVGTIGDWKTPEVRTYREEMKKVNDVTKEGTDAMAAFRAEMKKRFEVTRDIINQAKQKVDVQKQAIELDKQAAEASRQFYLAFRRQYDLGAVETVNRLARGFAWVAAANKDSSAEMARSVLHFQATFDLGRGVIETLLRMRSAYLALSSAVAVYNATQAASAAAGGSGAAGAFLGVGGRLGGLLAGGATGALAVASSPITLGVGGLAAVGTAHWGAGAIQRGESSMFEGMFNHWGTGMLMGEGWNSQLTSQSGYRQMQENGRMAYLQNEFRNQSRFGSEYDLRRQMASGNMMSLAALSAETRGNIASSQSALRAGVSDDQRMGLTSRLFEDFKRLDGLLREEAQIKAETSRNAIRGETERLNLLERELHQAERIYETKKREIEHGASSFAQMRPWEQRRAKDAFADLQAGKDISRRDRDLLESIGTTNIQEMLQKKDMRTAMKGGFGAMVTSEQAAMDSAARDVEKRKGDIAESEKTIQALKEEAEKTGQAFADKTKEVMQKMLEAYRAKMDAEQTVENNSKSSQRRAAGL